MLIVPQKSISREEFWRRWQWSATVIKVSNRSISEDGYHYNYCISFSAPSSYGYPTEWTLDEVLPKCLRTAPAYQVYRYRSSLDFDCQECNLGIMTLKDSFRFYMNTMGTERFYFKVITIN